jgi:hypothetical protein
MPNKEVFMATLDKEIIDIEKLKLALEEAEIVKTHMELVLMNPQMDPAIRKKYNETLPRYKNRIKDLRHKIALHKKMEESLKADENRDTDSGNVERGLQDFVQALRHQSVK